MARVLQLRRGTTAENDLFTGAVGELTMDTTTNELRIHDGSTVGGHTLANGADTDLSNLTATGKSVCANLAMPSDSYDNLTLGASDTYYTAPSDGYFFIGKTANSGQFFNAYIVPANSTNRLLGANRYSNTNGVQAVISLPARKGQRLFITYTASGSTNYFRFVYAQGEA